MGLTVRVADGLGWMAVSSAPAAPEAPPWDRHPHTCTPIVLVGPRHTFWPVRSFEAVMPPIVPSGALCSGGRGSGTEWRSLWKAGGVPGESPGPWCLFAVALLFVSPNLLPFPARLSLLASRPSCSLRKNGSRVPRPSCGLRTLRGERTHQRARGRLAFDLKEFPGPLQGSLPRQGRASVFWEVETHL